ncbi:MAG: ThiF family adenylyltransferase [Planctomycetes bacterium]|nr:ThiF family adenylyltransferase [Planctomycetota bacterium]
MPDDVLKVDDLDRYAPFRLISWWRQETLARARVMVVGAGALGNEVLKNLALLGVGHIYLIDCDMVEVGNLGRSVLYRPEDAGRPKADRAATAVRAINPDVKVRPCAGNVLTDVGLGVFAEMDAVIGCVDNREARWWINRQCWKANRPWVDGAIQEISGTVKVFVPPDGACYECGMTETDYRLLNRRYSCPLLHRDDIAEGKVPTTPTIASIVAGLQTQEGLKLLHGWPAAEGTALVFNGDANQFYATRYQRREDCLAHHTVPPPIDLPLRASSTAVETLAAAGGDALVLDRDLVVSRSCPVCGTREEVLKPRASVAARDGLCARCGALTRTEMIHEIEKTSRLAGYSMSALGVPPFDIVSVRAGGEIKFCRLAGDRSDALDWR